MNKYEQRSRDNYNQKALNYDETPEGQFTAKYQRLLMGRINIEQNDRILDVACGTGSLLRQLGGKKAIEGYGVDISEKMVEQAKKLSPSMSFSVAACDKLPFEANFFNTVTVCAAFHHFPHVLDFAKEVRRVIKPKGMIYIAELHMPTFWRAVINPFVKFTKDGDVKIYSSKEIVDLFERNGFTKEKVDIIDGAIQIVALRAN